MMRYVREVEAFQMTAERVADHVDWPPWLLEAWRDHGYPLPLGCVCPDTYPNHSTQLLLCVWPNGPRPLSGRYSTDDVAIIFPGDWIVRDFDGHLDRIDQDVFAARYRPVGHSGLDAVRREA